MKKICKYFFLLISLSFGEGWGAASAQNLVPNYSFEDTVACPTGISQITNAVGWSSYRETPDYLNTCSTGQAGAPSNLFGYQNARTGNGYAGFYSYAILGNNREFLGVQLTQALSIGQVYFVSFFVSRAFNPNPGFHINIANNKLGIRFSTVPFSYTDPAPIDNFSHVYTDSIIQDTLNWIKISGSFIADSVYTFLSIGNFFNNSSTSHIEFDSLASLAYYYVDDVCVSTDSLTCSGEIIDIIEEEHKLSIDLYPNPSNGIVYLNTNSDYPLEIIIYSSVGKQVLNTFLKDGKKTIDISQCAEGIYFITIKQKSNIVQRKIIKL